ncbi:hypothetical protein [Ekhidna sp.]|uniref:hypothetical protein n=1 Tax=Ekhidna sp. TaxID=2608089 RepID=UPI003B502C73
MPERTKFLSKKSFRLLLGILLILGGAFTSIFFLGKYYAGDILNTVIKRETNGFYQLNFESLDLDLLESRITLKSLRLQADSTQDFSALGLNNIYEIQLEELIIDLESVYALYMDKELIIKNVRVVDPNIDMVTLENSKQTKFSFEAGNMYRAISDYLKVLKIDYFRIQDGELQYDGDQFALGKIDFIVKNLVMDSVSRKNKVFYSEEIELEIRNQLFHLPDSIHEITFDKFVLSTSDSILSFENLRVQPMASSNVTFEGQNEVNVYEIHVPKLSFKGVDYVEAYQNNHLVIEELIFNEPVVFVDDETHAASTKKEIDNSLLTLIFDVFGSLDIGKLTINNAHVDLKLDGVDKYQRFKVERSNIVFYNIHLDTSNYRFDHRFRYFEDIELDIHNYTYLLPDSLHTVFFELLRINSFDSELRFENMSISHERAGNEAKVLLNVDIPVFNLKNVDFQRAIADKLLIVGKLEIPSSSIRVRNTGSSNGKQASVPLVYQALKPFFREISIDRLSINDINLMLPKGLKMGKINLTANDIHLSGASKGFQQLFDKSELKISEFELDRDSIVVNGSELLISNMMSSFQFRDWDFDINKKNQKVVGSLDTLQIIGVVLDSLIAGDFTEFSRAKLFNPNIEFDIQTSENKGATKLGNEKEFIVSGGKLKGKLDSTEIYLDGLDADVFVGDSTAFRSVGIENIQVRSAKHNHIVNLANWKYDTLNGLMEFTDLRIDPINKTDTSKSQIIANIPFLRLTKFEQSKFFDENHFFAGKLLLQSPNVKIKTTREINQKDSVSENSFTLSIEELQIDSADFSIEPGNSKALEKISINEISTTIYGINYPKDQPFENGFIFSDSIIFNARSILPRLQSGDSINLENIEYSTRNGDLLIDSIRYNSAAENIFMNIPSIEMRALDVKTLYENGGIIMDTLFITNPRGHNYLIESKEGKPFATPISIGYIEFDDLDWKYYDTISHKNYHLQHATLKIDQFNSKDTLTLNNITSKLESLTLNAGPLELPVADDYLLSVGNYQFDFPANRLELNHVKVNSIYSAQEFSEIISEQADWFDIAVQEIGLNRIDIYELISEQTLKIGRIDIDGLYALIYRDKGVPFPEDQVRPLPQQSIRDIKQLFQIDTIDVKGTIRYQEKPDNYYTHGEISFDELDAQLFNVGNISLTENEMMLLSGTGQLMGAGRFEVSGAFDLLSKDEQFSLSGSVVDFPLDSMNRMLGPVANVNIKSGYTKELFFNFSANDTLARGEMRFRYEDLKIQILNVKTHDTHGLGQGIKTFFANTFVVKSKNPSYFLFPRKGTIFQRRDTSRAIFNYWGKALLSGTVSSIGVHKSDKAEKKFERNFEE